MKRILPGLHVQWPWSRLLIQGKKIVETRHYPLPEKYIGVELAVIETPGLRGKKEAGINQARIIGTIIFSGSFQYRNKSSWLKDNTRHLVEPSDPLYGYKPNKVKWGWEVASVNELSEYLPPPKRRGIVFANGCSI